MPKTMTLEEAIKKALLAERADLLARAEAEARRVEAERKLANIETKIAALEKRHEELVDPGRKAAESMYS